MAGEAPASFSLTLVAAQQAAPLQIKVTLPRCAAAAVHDASLKAETVNVQAAPLSQEEASENVDTSNVGSQPVHKAGKKARGPAGKRTKLAS